MRKWIFLCAIAVAATSCDNRRFTIEGRVADAEGEVLYLESQAGQPAIIDSVELDKTGRLRLNRRLRNIPNFINCG